MTPSQVAERIAQALQGSPTRDEAISMAWALFGVVAQLEPEDPEELADLVAESEDLSLTPERRDIFAQGLAQILAADPLVTSSKAIDVLTDHEHLFESARILADVRPVFGHDPAAPPAGAVVFLMLKLDHFTDDQHRTLSVALDEADLEDLKAAVDRALTKMDTLKSFLAAAGLSFPEYRKEADAPSGPEAP